MQIRARSEAKRILRVLSLRCASVDMAARKILAQRRGQRKQTRRRWLRAVLRLRTEDEPEEFGVEEKDSGGDDPGDHGRQARICEFSHPGAAVGELVQGNHREGQLKTENHLTENEQRGHFVLAGKTNDQGRRNDGEGAGDEPAKPRLEANVEKAFHDDLASQCASQRGVLAGGKQRASEKRAGEARPEDGGEKFVGVGDFGDVVKAAGVESSGAKNENRRIDKKRKAEGQRGIKYGVAHRFAPVARGGPEGACLYDAGVKIEIVRHDRGAKDAGGDVEHFAVAEDFGTGEEADSRFAPQRMGEKDFVSETSCD